MSIARWNLKEAGCGEHTNPWAKPRPNEEGFDIDVSQPGIIAIKLGSDFVEPENKEYGKAIFNKSVYKLILHLDKDDCEDVKKLVRLNENETDLVAQFTTGDALFVCGNRRIPIHVHLTEKEKYEMRMS